MAGETYYFLFSIIAVITAVLHIVNILYFRAKGKTIMGEAIKPGTLGYEKFERFSSASGLAIAAILTMGFIANLAYDIYRILNLGKPEYARSILVYGPIAMALFFTVMLLVTHNILRTNKHD